MWFALFYARSHRALLYRSVGRLRWFACAATWTCQSSVDVLAATRNTTSGELEHGGEYKERQKELWENLFSNPSEWWDNRLDKRSSSYPDFRHRRTKEPLWLNNQYKPIWVDSQLGTLYTKLLRTPHQVGSLRPDYELVSLCDEGQVDKALDILVRMDQQGAVPSANVYSSLLRACAKRKALAQAKRLRVHLAKHGLESTRFFGEYIVSTLVKCGGLEDALQIFHSLPNRTVFSWTAVISGYSTTGQGKEALRMYELMQEQGLQPNNYTFVSLLKACGSLCDLKQGRYMHSEALRYGCQTDSFVGASLVDMYAKCGSLTDARHVFDGLSHRSVVSWNTMLAAYSQQGESQKALQLYDKMCKERISPDNRTFVSVLQACGMLAEQDEGAVVGWGFTKAELLKKGKSVHADARKRGYDSDVFVGCTLVSMYGKCGSITDAQDVFDSLSQRDAVSWNVMLAACVQQGRPKRALQLYDQLREETVSPDDRTFVSALQACSMIAEKEENVLLDGRLAKPKSLERGESIHIDTQKKGYDSHVFVGNALITMYGKCGSIINAQDVFDKLSKRDVVSWSAMLAAFAQQGLSEKALDFYEKMRDEGASPNERTFVSALQACGLLAEKEKDVTGDRKSARLKSLEMGKAIHADAKKKGYESDVFVSNSLVSMYGKCGSIVDAQDVFDGLLKRDVVSWNAMLAAYVEQGQGEKALQLYRQMQEEGARPDVRTFAITLQACGMLAEKEDVMMAECNNLRSLERGKALHADAERKGYASNVFVGSALVSMYGKCGSILEARDVFDGLIERDIVSWNTMLTAYVEHDQAEKALQLYKQMQEQGFSLNEITFLSILQASSNTGSLDVCRQVHHAFVSAGNYLSPLLATTLIHAYGRCASMVDAQTVFDLLLEPNAVTWTALIAGYARQGSCTESLQCYEEMQLAGMKPDGVTFLAVLSACSHAGLVDKGVEYFESMSRDHDITPGTEHYACILDLLGRAGYFSQVEHLLSIMPMQPDLSMWLSVLGACRKHGKVMLGKRAFDCAVHLQPKDSAAYVLMLNIYADAELWNDAKLVKELRHKAGAWKTPGQSWIQYEQESHNFVVGDLEHSQQDLLYGMLGKVSSELQEKGHSTICSDSDQGQRNLVLGEAG